MGLRYWLLILSFFLIVFILSPYCFNYPFSLSEYTENEKLQSLIVTFSMGFILSALFHGIVNVLPQSIRKRKIKKGIEKELEHLELYMTYHIMYIKYWNHGIDLDRFDEDQIQHPKFDGNRYTIRGKLQFSKPLKKEPPLYGEPTSTRPIWSHTKTRLEFFRDYSERIVHLSNYLVNLSFIDSQDIVLIETLIRLRQSGYIDIIRTLQEYESIGDFGREFREFYNLFRKLKKYSDVYSLEDSFINEFDPDSDPSLKQKEGNPL